MKPFLLLGLCLLLASIRVQAGDFPALLGIVIDDMGANPARDRQALTLPREVALSILPEGKNAPFLAQQAHRQQRTVLLHLPMAPSSGPYAWQFGQSEAQRQERLYAALARVPEAQGVNNHQGSQLTADRQAMMQLMPMLQTSGLFFLDSRTSSATVAAAEAQRIGLASLSRDVFLDNDTDEMAIARQLQKGIALARQQGSAILIGHPHPSTLRVLSRELPKLEGESVELSDLRLIIAFRGNRAMRSHGRNGVYSNRLDQDGGILPSP